MMGQLSKPSVPGPSTIVRSRLDNGILVQVYENPTSPSVTTSVRLRAGSLWVPREKAGLAGFAGDMMMRGTANRTFDEINEAIEGVGATMDFDADWTATGCGGRCLAEDLPLFFDVLSDCLLAPAFPDDHVEKVRGEILTALEQRAHDTRRMATLGFYETLYKGHPLSNSSLGYTETISALTRDDLAEFYRAYYQPQGVIVTLVGAIAPEEALALVERSLGGWSASPKAGEMEIPDAARPESVLRTEVTIPGKTQADIVLGNVGVRRLNPDYVTARVANTVLGVFGMMGRVGKNVREEKGLAYYAFTTLVSGLAPGPWLAVAGVNPANVEQAAEGILTEMRRLRDEPVPEDELEETKSYLIGSMPLALETNSGIAATLQAMEVFDLGLDYLERYPSMIRAITADDVQRVARTYLDPEAYAISIARPA